MRVTQIMLAAGFGGAERHFVDISRALAASGVVVQAICHPGFTRRDALEGIDGITVCPIRVPGSWDRTAVWRIARRLDTFRPDLVHTHLSRAGLLGGAAAHARALPVIANLHTNIKLKRYRHVERFVAATVQQVGYLRERGIDGDRIVRIPHFTFANTAPERPPQGEPTFVALGRFVPKKGFDVLLDALARLLTAGIRCRLVLAGDGPERPALQERADRLGIAAHVSLPGWVNDPAAAFSQTDIFVLPSLREPFGIVLLEAMAARLPIVATRTEGPLEILDDDAAYLVAPGQAVALARAMQDAASDWPERTARARRAHGLLTAKYTADVVIPRYLDTYREVAGMSCRRR
ncbi:MAG: glycosyltransferase [Gammaproteobacteria bacterium]|nr:glycosyltransferase [Gammaproteobacteria bacterium]MCP5200303.1 glycosyltransferase [Gammaproteobacteria bacterium]